MIRKIAAFAALVALALCLPATSPAQWIDLTKPSEPRTPAVPEITPTITALTHAINGIDGLAFSRDGKLLAVCGGTGDVPQSPKSTKQVAASIRRLRRGCSERCGGQERL